MSYAKIWVHAVWGTKYRAAVLKPPILRKMCDHIRANARLKGIYIDRINGHDDHIHVLMLLKPEFGISKQMQLLKGESSFWANQNNLLEDDLQWAHRYYASSVSIENLDIVRKYIDNQQIHHRRNSFEEEYKAYLASVGCFDTDLG